MNEKPRTKGMTLRDSLTTTERVLGCESGLRVVLRYTPFVPKGHMTETVKVEVNEELARRFREKAMGRYGYKKGALKKALENLLQEFARNNPARPNWSSLSGTIKHEYKA